MSLRSASTDDVLSVFCSAMASGKSHHILLGHVMHTPFFREVSDVLQKDSLDVKESVLGGAGVLFHSPTILRIANVEPLVFAHAYIGSGRSDGKQVGSLVSTILSIAALESPDSVKDSFL